MFMDLISIIVPVYNVEKYLEECVKSIINQTYHNIEILLIDDGSKDSSGSLCDQLALLDKRIRVFHRDNFGLSSTRNFGIEFSKGKYISFIDSDDIIANDFIEFLYNNMLEHNVKISSCSFIHYYDDHSVNSVMVKNVDIKYDRLDALKFLNVMGYFNASCCNKLFLKELFDDIKFPVGLVSEDLFIIYRLIDKANGLYFASSEKYFYRQRIGSITKNVKINYNVIDASLEQIEYLRTKGYTEILPFAYQTLFFAYLGVYNVLLCRNETAEKKKIYNKLLELKGKFSKEFISRSRKIQIFLFYFNIHLYNFSFKIFDMKRKSKRK